MGSRIKENPQKIFDLFFETACPVSGDDDPQVLRQFPLEFDDQESIQMLPRFCFPFDTERVQESSTVQHFTFALTDMEGKQRFGFCRLSIGFNTCLCILSYLPWFEVFYKILNYIADNIVKKQFTELNEFLSALHIHPMPNLNSFISLEFDPKLTKLKIFTEKDQNREGRSQDPGTALAYFLAPGHGKLPTVPENRNLTEFVVAVDVNNMLHLYASLLHERRILLTTNKLSTLTACVQASSLMLYPMHWQHIYIPALPSHLLDYCCAPMPYLIGVHTSLMERVRSKALEDVVILNIDSNTMESPFQDLESLPSDIVSLLKFQLKKQSATTGDGVARAFLRAQALLFGGYREALVCNPGEPISFCQESFLQRGSSAMQAFLQRAIHLQLFKEFIEDRLQKLNAGEDFSDHFEQEINQNLSPGSMHAYHLWLENLKKGGGALISTMKNKANPAVRSAYRYAKGHAKTRLKNMRSRLMDKSRPRRPQRSNSRTELENQRDVSPSLSTTSLDCSLDPYEGENLQQSSLDSGDFDLLGEIFETLNLLEPSPAGRPLYGTRSLDFCNLDEKNFYTKIRPSRETLYEPLSEEQDDGDFLFVDRMSLPSQHQESMQSALLLSMSSANQSHETYSYSTHGSQEVCGPEKASLPLQEEEEEIAAPDSNERSHVGWTQNADQEVSQPIAQRTESPTGITHVEESRADQILDVSADSPSPKEELPATSYSSIQAPAALHQTKVSQSTDVKVDKENLPALQRVTSTQRLLAPRPMVQPRVLELKKRFEA
ncbi:DENN domain-containing protein 1C isoform X2 [Anolis carolinensis]|uniref:UDENN domain-containing protein n=1 Tax=Anolis carolinensis TaxID=28377 RepID=A0A803TUJ4_ANOCA|nr:PREDICTED: DENN domain-containing protein 1C isoform X2 [Anolis carolinensis]|eukprot:XP_008101912.1 PREDICTED: DENN domain-containing protein 1C isoform X2 [Anolis carolinensis]